MIERVTIDGRKGSAAYVNQTFQPVDKADAAFIKVVFDDGGQLILNATPVSKKKT
jgi:hypothetical protein